MNDVRFAWVYVRDMKQFPVLNAEYAKHFPLQPPCRCVPSELDVRAMLTQSDRATVQLPWSAPGDIKIEFMVRTLLCYAACPSLTRR